MSPQTGRPLRLAFVVQRYGLEIAGGAEYHCRLVAEQLARHAQVEVVTTCAADYITWANHYREGVETLNGIPVRRFRVKRPRDPERFADWTDRVMRATAAGNGLRAERDSLPRSERAVWAPYSDRAGPRPPTESALERLAVRVWRGVRRSTPQLEDLEALLLRWLEEEGPFSPRLVRHLQRHRDDHDFFVFFSYRYYTTYHGLRAVRDRALLVPTAEDDGVCDLSIFPPLFRMPRALVYNSVEERAMIERASANQSVPGDVVGVGSALPERVDPDGFRARHGVAGRFGLYVGRIDQNKGCHQLFDFFRRYRQETGSPLSLLLVGKPVIPIPADPSMRHLGFLSDQQKWDALAASDLLFMPSRLESLSMVTLEAWWARRPVLANAKCEVLRGQCQRSNAGLYYSSYPEFRETLALMESSPVLRESLGENGRRYFDTHYAWNVVVGKYLALLTRLRAEDAARRAGQGA